jgi:hypothetical protein
MKRSVILAFATLLASAGAASAQQYAGPPPAPWHGCAETPHPDGGPCGCSVEGVFYRPGLSWSVKHAGGPGVRVYSRPVYVPSGRIDIEGPPIWVEAPPVRVAPTQIYLHPPVVHVRPSDVTVEPPQVNFVPCAEGEACKPGGERG